MSTGATIMLIIAIVLVWGGLVASIIALNRHTEHPEHPEDVPPSRS